MFSVYGYRVDRRFPEGGPQGRPEPDDRQLRQDHGHHDLPAPTCSAAPELTFSPTKHLGNHFSRLSQIQEGRWKVVSDYVKP